MKTKTYIMLGRTGDILNILPAIEYESKQNNYKPKLIVAKEYADVLDGCGDYVEKVVFPGNFKNINQAINLAYNNFPQTKIINCAIYGENFKIKRECSSFQRESWKFSECPIAWGRLSLNFPNRNNEREKQLLSKVIESRIGYKPIIITALSGHSSPFNYTNELLELLKSSLSEFQIFDISDLRAERFYDLLALYEKAHALIAIDSAPLHLANAVPNLPVISLISDLKDDWHRSSWRPNHILRLLYSEVPTNLDKIVKATREGNSYRKKQIHLVTSHKDKLFGEDFRRFEFAQKTWEDESKANRLIWNISYYRSTSIPKVKKMIDFVEDKIGYTDDIIMICNSDISFVPGITGWILHEVERHGAVYFHRHDFVRLTNPLISEADVIKGKWYCGSDAFAFTVEWWKENREDFPDMYFAREGWDMIMRNMIKRSGGTEIHSAIFHEKHKSFWEAPENKNCAENIHNRKLAQEWLNKYGGDWNDWKFTVQQMKGMYR